MNSDSKLSDAEKLATAKDYKEKGNAAHREGNFKKAAGSYHRAILYLKGISINCPDILSGLGASSAPAKMKPELETELQTLTCDCYNNLAACMLKLPEPNYKRIVEYCDTVLEISPSNVKALFRKGTALFSLKDYEDALRVLDKAPQESSVLKLKEQCKAGMKAEDKEVMKCYKAMFAS